MPASDKNQGQNKAVPSRKTSVEILEDALSKGLRPGSFAFRDFVENRVPAMKEPPAKPRDKEVQAARFPPINLYRKGGSVKSSASKRADGIAKKGKTRGTCK